MMKKIIFSMMLLVGLALCVSCGREEQQEQQAEAPKPTLEGTTWRVKHKNTGISVEFKEDNEVYLISAVVDKSRKISYANLATYEYNHPNITIHCGLTVIGVNGKEATKNHTGIINRGTVDHEKKVLRFNSLIDIDIPITLYKVEKE